MAPGVTSSVKPRRAFQGCYGALASAFLEWLLLFFLFIDAILSFFITRFAHYCDLQTPCLVCSRLDHVLSNKKLNYYWELICSKHKLEISSLVYCHAHNKLVDVHGMCENCLLSFATVNKSNAETYRLLVGKLGDESSFCFDVDPLLQGHKNTPSKVKHCSCCNEPWISRDHVAKLIREETIDSKNTEFDVPLSSGNDVDRVNHLTGGLETRPYVEYRELKINSDSESETLSENDPNDLRYVSDLGKENLAAQFKQLDPGLIILSNDLALERLIDPVAAVSPSFLDIQEKLDVDTPAVGLGLEELNWEQVELKADRSPQSKTSYLEKITIDASEENRFVSLENVFTSQIAEDSVDISRESKHISSDEVSLSSNSVETPAAVDVKSKDVPPLLPNEKGTSLVMSEEEQVTVNENDPSVLLSATDSPAEAPKDNYITSIELQRPSVTGNEEICKLENEPNASSETVVERNSVSNDTGGLQPTTSLDLSEAYKVAVSNRGRQLSEVLAEQWTGKDSSRLSEDLKLLLSQLSAARGFDQLTSDMSPRVSLTNEEVKSIDTSTSSGMQLLQKKFSLERNESGLESLDCAVSEIEGENLVDRLKRQVEHDKKLLVSVYKELEEERSASAVAVNQAMAMITRLQEEKASLHMEALQNLRMMEEQAEYDMEALQSTNDLLAEKEKEIQDLEDELEYFRKKYPNESMLETILKSNGGDSRRRAVDIDSEVTSVKASSPADAKSVTGSSKTNTSPKATKVAAPKNPLIDFGEERMSILQNLKELEKKICAIASNAEQHSDIVDEKHSENGGDDVSGSNDLICEEGHQLNGDAEETDSPMLYDAYASKEIDDDIYSEHEGDEASDSKDHNSRGNFHSNGEAEDLDSPMLHDVSASKESIFTDDVQDSSLEVSKLSSKESVNFTPTGQVSNEALTLTDIVSIAKEVSALHNKLDSLEADQNFLELTINSLQQGEEGIQFIQEIAAHLKDLRKIGLQIRDYPVA